ncbi:MAG: hypothetical protein AAFW65_02465 [Pseudomonadota bacterium]
MDLERLLKRMDDVDRRINRIVERVFILVAAGFGGWVVWTVLSAGGAGFVTLLWASLIGAAVCAGLMWLFWLIAGVFL